MKSIILSFLIIFFSCTSASYDRGQQIKKTYYTVTKVVDGDTFWVDNGSEKGLKIRLIGVDAPETQARFGKPAGFYGQESKDFLTLLIKEKQVALVSDLDSLDRYGRTLSYVYLKDGTFINAEMIINGFAVIMTIPPNVKYADHFYELQKEAHQNRKGIWAHDIDF